MPVALKFPTPPRCRNVTAATNSSPSSSSSSPLPLATQQRHRQATQAPALAAKEPAPAMEAFTDWTHVWLWVREYEAYLYAEEDGEDISCYDDSRGELHGAWAVHRLVRDGTDYVLFHSASYGRYLALNEDGEDENSYVATQCIYDSAEQVDVLFQARGAEDGSDDIILRNPRSGDFGYRAPDDEDAIMPLHFVVEAIPQRLFPPELPAPPDPIPPAPPVVDGPIRLWPRRRVVQAQAPQPVFRRTILYVRTDDHGNYNPAQCRVLFQFQGQSVFNLRRDIAADLGEANVLGITLCAWGGSYGRLTPLVIDLPSDEKTMVLIVLTTGSPAAQQHLVYANVDAA